MIRIDIPRRHYLLYLVLPHPVKVGLLSPASRERLDRINRGFNEAIYSGDGASAYDRLHRYAEAEQHEFPARALVESVWAPDGFGRALELGAGTGYFTTLIARRATSVLAVEPVADMRRVLGRRCAEEGIANVAVIDASAFELGGAVPDGSVDSVVLISCFHHFHRRPEVFAALARAVRRGGHLYMVEPHHNVRRVARLVRKWWTSYRRPAFRQQERNWATHDFLTRREIQRLCADAGFERVDIAGYWIPLTKRLVPDPPRRFALETRLGRLPVIRHMASVLAVQARRR
jgi:ubiquinone/menaquinone biosynthesis C-methylase UbiE